VNGFGHVSAPNLDLLKILTITARPLGRLIVTGNTFYNATTSGIGAALGLMVNEQLGDVDTAIQVCLTRALVFLSSPSATGGVQHLQ
jgi:hypothetical protein